MKQHLICIPLILALSSSASAESYYAFVQAGGAFFNANGGTENKKLKVAVMPFVSIVVGKYIFSNIRAGLGLDLFLPSSSGANVFSTESLQAIKALPFGSANALEQSKIYTNGFNIAPQIECVFAPLDLMEFSVGVKLGLSSLRVQNIVDVANKSETFANGSKNISYAVFASASYKFLSTAVVGVQVSYGSLGNLNFQDQKVVIINSASDVGAKATPDAVVPLDRKYKFRPISVSLRLGINL
jgi:hypothetical protein